MPLQPRSSAFAKYIRQAYPLSASAEGGQGMRSGSSPLPEQLIRQPPPTPFHVPIFFMPHFIKFSARFCKL